MNKLSPFIKYFTVILVSGLLSAYSNVVFAQDYVDIVYSDSYTSGSKYATLNTSMLTKEQRASSQSSSIIITNEDELDENTLIAVKYAKSVWESIISNSVNLFIEVKIADIEEDIRTTVKYQKNNGILIPTSLAAYIHQSADRDYSYPDGIIYIRSNTSWDYGLNSNKSPEGLNLAYGIIRAIARTLGFGSSILMDQNGNYMFADKRYHTIFNTMVHNSSNIKLNTLSINGGRPSNELKTFIENPAQTFWISGNNGEYKLSSPPYDLNNPPFVYLEDVNSLMKKDLLIGDYILQVDNKTLDILNTLGWNTIKANSLTISSDDVSDNGLASAYASHNFRINTGNQSISAPKWFLHLPLKNGEIQKIQLQDNNLSCTTPIIENEDLFKINLDGDIEAKLHFSCTIDGKEVKANPFKIFFELKPFIEYANIEKIVDNSPLDSYDAYYKVKYRGADKIKVSVEEEFSSKLKSNYLYEPYIAYGIADHITSPFYAWIDFIAENKYGRSVYTIELQPFGVVQKMSVSDNQLINIDEVFVIYDLCGIKLGQFNNLIDIKSLQYKGVVIVKHIVNDEIIETKKIFL